jgi:hypothetical protein
MRPFLNKSSFAGIFAAVLIVAAAQISPAAQPHANPVLGPAASNWRAMLDKYCVTCHNERAKIGGLALDRLDLKRVPDQAETWEKVVRKLHAAAMPPVGLPRPSWTSKTNAIARRSILRKGAASGTGVGHHDQRHGDSLRSSGPGTVPAALQYPSRHDEPLGCAHHEDLRYQGVHECGLEL